MSLSGKLGKQGGSGGQGKPCTLNQTSVRLCVPVSLWLTSVIHRG